MTYTTRLGTLVIEVPTTVETPPNWPGWRFTEGGRYPGDAGWRAPHAGASPWLGMA